MRDGDRGTGDRRAGDSGGVSAGGRGGLQLPLSRSPRAAVVRAPEPGEARGTSCVQPRGGRAHLGLVRERPDRAGDGRLRGGGAAAALPGAERRRVVAAARRTGEAQRRRQAAQTQLVVRQGEPVLAR